MTQALRTNYDVAKDSFLEVVGELGDEIGFRMTDLPDVYTVHDVVTAAWHHLDETADTEAARELIRFSLLEAAGIEVDYGQHAAA